MRIANFARCFALLVTFFLVPALAEDAAGLSSDLDREQAFSIDAQALDAALLDFSDQANVQIMVATSTVEGLQTEGVEGTLTPRLALTVLLDDNDLRFTEVGNTVAVTSAPRQRGDSDSKNSSAMPVLMAQGQASGTQAGMNAERSSPLEIAESRDGRRVTPLEEIVVTGTNIRGVENPTVPVLTFDKEDIDLSGATTVDEFLRTIPQNFASQTQLTAESGNPHTATNLTQGTTVDLRGLGPGSTLTLLNGRRMTPAGQSNFVDVNVLPLGILERVDVLTDGATAIYGSDAVGGVVNFVTRKDYEGFDINARYGTVTEGSKEDWGVGGAGGINWGSGGVFAGVDFYEAKPLLLEERDFVNLLLPQEGAVFGSDTERLSMAGGANQEFGSTARLAVDLLYTDLNNAAGRIAGFLPTTLVSGQEAVFINSRFEYDVSDDITASFFFDYGRNDVKRIAGFEFSGTPFELSTELGNTLHLYEGRVSGKVVDLLGGQVSFSVGGLYREEEFNEDSNGFLIDGMRNVAAGYVEVLVPIIGAQNALPFVRNLQLSLAGRYEDYSDVGDSLDPKIGVFWAVNDQFSLRASYSESFRAPDLQQLNGPEIYSVNPFPVDSITAFPAPPPSPIFSDFPAVLAIVPIGTNRNLTPESAKAWSAGFSFEPGFVEGLSVEGNYFRINYSNRIEGISFAQIVQDASLAQLVDLAPDLSDVEAIFARAEAGEISLSIPGSLQGILGPEDIQLVLQSGLQNLSERNVRGFDVNVNYVIDTGLGQFSAGANASYLIDFIGRLAPTSPSAEQINVLYRPVDFKMRTNLGWSHNGFTVFAALNYVDGYRDNIDVSIAEGIDAWTTIDLSLAYDTADRFGDVFINDLRLGFSVTNLFDNDPPFVETPFGLNFDTANADPFGRQANFTLTKRF